MAELVASGEQRAASFSLESLAKRYLDLYDEARRRHEAARRPELSGGRAAAACVRRAPSASTMRALMARARS